MTLSQLVDLKTRIENFNILRLQSTAKNLSRELDSWRYFATSGEIKEDLDFLLRTFDSIDANITSLNSLLMHELQKKVLQEIENKSSQFLSLGYEIKGEQALKVTENAGVDREFRKIEISEEFREQLGSRIRNYTDWRYPSLEIGPGDGFWTYNLIGSDPLYLVDIHKEYLENTLLQFTDAFKKKVRCYLIGPEVEKSCYNIDMLPKNQLGFIFSWGVFDFIPYKQTKGYIENCYNLLRPGGIMAFSFNNCDFYKAAASVEGGQRSWMTQHLLQQLFDGLGIETLGFYHSDDLEHHWVEIKKPGNKTSIKTHQPLVSINNRPGVKKVDVEPEKHYNVQQVARLKQIAIKMGIDKDEYIMAGKYSPRELEKMINIARMNK